MPKPLPLPAPPPPAPYVMVIPQDWTPADDLARLLNLPNTLQAVRLAPAEARCRELQQGQPRAKARWALHTRTFIAAMVQRRYGDVGVDAQRTGRNGGVVKLTRGGQPLATVAWRRGGRNIRAVSAPVHLAHDLRMFAVMEGRAARWLARPQEVPPEPA
jgi:hypothetical protein